MELEKRWTRRTRPRATWERTTQGERARVLERIAQRRIEDNLEMLATIETWDNGKPIRETMAADLPLAVDHFRYFAGAIRAQEELDLGDRWDDGFVSPSRAAGRNPGQIIRGTSPS